MDFLTCLAFASGVAGFTYSKMGRRVGYENTGNVTLVVGVVFVFAFLFFFTVLKFLLHM